MAAVASRASAATNSPHMGANNNSNNNNSNATSGMNSSPRTTRNTQHLADSQKDSSHGQDNKSDLPAIKPPTDSKDSKVTAGNAPLAPPPKPNANAEPNEIHGHFSKEPNPFESAFGGGPTDTPGKTQLPGVTSLTSPAPLLPGNTPAWPGSLRSGPLSPAMLPGPTGSTNDYFNSDHHFGGSFPTPNESSLRTGLTPGGGGSMFPQPSPNSQALYNQLQSGGATPGTLDFHRTAMTARAQSQSNNYGITSATSQPASNPNIQPDLDSKAYNSNAANHRQQDSQDPFSSHQTNDAANGLFMLAQAGGQRGAQPSYPMSSQAQQHPSQTAQSQQPYSQNAVQDHRTGKNSIDSTMSNSTQGGQGEFSDASTDAKPQTRARGKKTNSAPKAPANGKRKPDELPVKGGNKKSRGSVSSIVQPDDLDDEDMDEDMEMPDGRKMTDEEKRKNFLERNRVAALKCRQRKKQWLANLQQKVEIFSSENDALAATVTQLREEIVGLKTLLLAHKDCPVSQAQGISGMAMQQITGDAHQYANPYGMAMGPGQAQMAQAGMQRR